MLKKGFIKIKWINKENKTAIRQNRRVKQTGYITYVYNAIRT